MTNPYSSAASNYPRNRSSIVARSMILARGCPLVPALRQAFFFTFSDGSSGPREHVCLRAC